VTATDTVRTAQIERLRAYAGHKSPKIAAFAKATLEAHSRGDAEAMARINVAMMKHVLKRIGQEPGEKCLFGVRSVCLMSSPIPIVADPQNGQILSICCK